LFAPPALFPSCSYQIRSIPTISGDRIYCKVLAHNAVHAAFAGYTGVTTGLVNTHVRRAACSSSAPSWIYACPAGWLGALVVLPCQ
jgi:hypothetical protein